MMLHRSADAWSYLRGCSFAIRNIVAYGVCACVYMCVCVFLGDKNGTSVLDIMWK